MREEVREMKQKKIVAAGAVVLGLLMTITPAYAKGYQLTERGNDNGKTTWEFEGDPIVLPLDLNNSVDLSTLSQEERAKLVASWHGDNADRDGHWNDDSDDEDSNDEESDDSSNEFDIDLSGDEEVPAVDSDGEGSANVRLHKDHSLVCVDVEVSGITLPATDTHIHKAVKGQAGPVALALPLPNEDGDAYGCVKADSAAITDMMAHPENYYVNVHSTEHPDGELRGQLSNSE